MNLYCAPVITLYCPRSKVITSFITLHQILNLSMKKIECAGGIVLGPSRGVLVVTNQIGKVTLPKGTVKKHETHIVTALREIREEGGLNKVDIIKELGTIIRPGFTAENAEAPSVTKHIRMFLCVTGEIELKPVVDDIEKAEWVNPNDVAAVLHWPEEVAFFKEHRRDVEQL